MASEELVNGAEASGVAAAADGGKKSKADKEKERRKKKKLNKQLRRQEQPKGASGAAVAPSEDGDDEDIVVEYVSAPLDLETLRGEGGASTAAREDADAEEEDPDRFGMGFGGGLGFGRAAEPKPQASMDPYEEFKRVFERFASAEEVTGTAEMKDTEEGDERAKDEKKATTSEQGSDDEEGEGVEGKLSKKKLKLLNRLKVAELKAVCVRPEVVEVWDVTGPDPPLLVFLKAGVKALYDARVAELRSANRREDFSDMVASKAASQKRKQQASQDAKTAKKSKGDNFKF
ncbi:Splicing factor 3B subunit 2 [Tetrabaena socialis]|uniref:Splicing factor 3B subunit 2 n=1 Tax=Tetrabaena socialis TaxID=47790 RepID=A0A2J8AGR4_9CHLO|nr:Splicing factor 3B subunit 2 [Tetrabaena socialis]|eukprot:PNH11686.1 Splicing factor 3B subunit 2 [Tetrabaena socialis]